MISIHRSEDRGRTRLDWLDSRHSFSFGEWRDPDRMGFRSLRVINEDVVLPMRGFGQHPHRDMEILTWVLSGALEHKDSTGGRGVIRPGEIQRMTAGAGVVHSEMNLSAESAVHLLQIWILPERLGLPPGYEQRAFAESDLADRLRLVASREARYGAVKIHQDAALWIGRLRGGASVEHTFASGRHGWVQVARGRVALGGGELAAGDAASLSDERSASLRAVEPAEILLFDLS